MIQEVLSCAYLNCCCIIFFFLNSLERKENCFSLFSPNKCEQGAKCANLCSVQHSVLFSKNQLNHYGISGSEFINATKNLHLEAVALGACFLKKQGKCNAATQCSGVVHVSSARELVLTQRINDQ